MIPIALTIAAATAVGYGVEARIGEVRSHVVVSYVMATMLWVLLPPVVFLNIADLELSAGNGLGALFGWAGMGAAMVAAYLIGTRVFGLERPSVGTMMLAAGLGNSGYLGLPLTAALFGFDEVGDAIVFDVLVAGLGLVTLGFAIGAAFGTVASERRERIVSFFTRNPALWAASAGALAPAALAPEWAVDASRIGVFAMLPLSFFVVGITLSGAAGPSGRRFPPPLSAPVAATMALKLLLMPAIVLGLSLTLVEVPGSYISQAAMACGINTLLISHVYGMNRALAASAVGWSTVLVVAVGLVADLA